MLLDMCNRIRLPHPIMSQGEGSLCSHSLKMSSFLSQMLTSRQESAPNLAIIEAFRSAKYSLTTAITSLDGKAALPEKENIAPNQKSWPETAKCMGTKKIPRCPCLADEHGLTEHSIGAIKGKHKHIHNDPYAGEECSGEHAKPNACARAPSPLNTHFPDTSPITCPPGMPPPTFFPPFANGPHY